MQHDIHKDMRYAYEGSDTLQNTIAERIHARTIARKDEDMRRQEHAHYTGLSS